MVLLQLFLDTDSAEENLEIEIPEKWCVETFDKLLLSLFTQKSYVHMVTPGSDVSVRYNVDTPEIYTAFYNIVNSWSNGLCELSISTRSGHNLEIETPVQDTLIPVPKKKAPIVLKQTFNPIEWYGKQAEDCDQLLEWMRISTVLYVLDKRLDKMKPDWNEPLTSMVEETVSTDLIITNPHGKLEITETGKTLLGTMIKETESYIEKYDMFKDVLYDSETFSARFGTGHGQDIRVQVYESEGFDSVRIVFMLMLYDGTLELALTTRNYFSLSNRFFNNLLMPVLDRVIVDESDIDWIVDAGFEDLEYHRASQRTISEQTDVLNTINFNQQSKFT